MRHYKRGKTRVRHKALAKSDLVLLTSVSILFLMSLISLYSASYMPGSAPEKNFALQQLLWFGGAAVVFIFILWVGYERLIDYSYILFAVNIIGMQ